MKIGVLGGIGPEATVSYYKRFIGKLQHTGIRKNSDFPQIIINSIPAKELTGKVTKNDLKMYVDGLQDLDKQNPDVLVMVCNTIHSFYAQLKKQVQAPILNLPAEVGRAVAISGAANYAVLGTETTLSSLYHFQDRKKVPVQKEDTNIIKQAILHFNRGYRKDQAIEKVTRLCNTYLQKADVIILGCTELALMFEDERAIDTIEVLVDATLKKYKEHTAENR